MEQTYRYAGPVSAIPTKGKSYALVPGKDLVLPSDHPTVKRLLARGAAGLEPSLVAVASSAPAAAPSTSSDEAPAPELAPSSPTTSSSEAPSATSDESTDTEYPTTRSTRRGRS